jgi:hypothetical protein
MTDFSNEERGMPDGGRALNRSALLSKVPEGNLPPADTQIESKYWKEPTRVHRVVFPNVKKIGLVYFDGKFDFKPAADGKSGEIVGTGFARSYHGKYQLRNTADRLDMRVTIESDDPNEKTDTTLSIGKEGARVSGTLMGKPQSASDPVPVVGKGTDGDPFRAKFPQQEVQWYLP